MILALSVLTISCTASRKQPVADYPDSHRVAKATNQKQTNVLSPESSSLEKEKSQKQAGAEYPDSHRVAKPTQHSQYSNIEQRILDQYQRWKGTRHQLGGTGSQGVDCSGFVKAVYRDAFNISLPRTTITQVHEGKSVSLNELQPGDLVFFKRFNPVIWYSLNHRIIPATSASI
jgi:cell wall-associated NlpC family hydrolase